jgi:hypothetical protein
VSHLYSRIPKLKHLLVGPIGPSHRWRFASRWPAPVRRSVLCSVLKVCSTSPSPLGGGVAAHRTGFTWSTEPLENCIASTSIFVLPSYKEPTVDALASTTDEGRVWLRKATVSCLESVTNRGCPNGETHHLCGWYSRVNT